MKKILAIITICLFVFCNKQSKEYKRVITEKEVQREQIEFCIQGQSDNFNLEYALIKAIIKHETIGTFNPNLTRFEKHLKKEAWYTNHLSTLEKQTRESFCSVGLMQVLFGVAKHLGYKDKPDGLKDINENIYWGSKHLRNLSRKYSNIKDVISAYNQGKPKKTRSGKYRNQGYVDSVYRYYRQYGGER